MGKRFKNKEFNDSPFKGDPHWKCNVCKKKFASKGLMKQHKRRVHND